MTFLPPYPLTTNAIQACNKISCNIFFMILKTRNTIFSFPFSLFWWKWFFVLCRQGCKKRGMISKSPHDRILVTDIRNRMWQVSLVFDTFQQFLIDNQALATSLHVWIQNSKQKGFLVDFLQKNFLLVAVLSSRIAKGRQQKDKLFCSFRLHALNSELSLWAMKKFMNE